MTTLPRSFCGACTKFRYEKEISRRYIKKHDCTLIEYQCVKCERVGTRSLKGKHCE